MKPAVTIRQIARESGVSVSTVSRVINGSAPVSEDVRRRVERAIEKYAYAPSGFARGLVSRRSMIIGVIMPDITNPYFTAMFREISLAAQRAGYSVLLFNTGFSAATAGETTRNELEAFKVMQEKGADGVLVVGGQADLVRLRPEYRRGLEDMANRDATASQTRLKRNGTTMWPACRGVAIRLSHIHRLPTIYGVIKRVRHMPRRVSLCRFIPPIAWTLTGYI